MLKARRDTSKVNSSDFLIYSCSSVDIDRNPHRVPTTIRTAGYRVCNIRPPADRYLSPRRPRDFTFQLQSQSQFHFHQSQSQSQSQACTGLQAAHCTLHTAHCTMQTIYCDVVGKSLLELLGSTARRTVHTQADAPSDQLTYVQFVRCTVPAGIRRRLWLMMGPLAR